MSTQSTAQTVAPRTNWAGNLAYRAGRFVVPASVEEAQEAVRAADKVRVVGSRHSFNDIADTTGTHLSLERLNRVLSLDTAKSQVTVEGGIRYGEIGPYLHERGYALHNTASLPHISIAGACATATHGSGALGNLAIAVAAMEFIDGKGDLVTLSRDKDGDTFAGAVVNLGALGVVTKLTLDLQPAFHIRQDVFRDLPLAALEDHFDEIMSSGYSVSIFTGWQSDTIEQVWIKSAVEPGAAFAARDSLFGARPATREHASDRRPRCRQLHRADGRRRSVRMIACRISAWGSRRQAATSSRSSTSCRCRHAVGAIRALRRQGDRMAAALADGRDTHDRRRRTMDEPLLPDRLRGLPFFLQAGLAGAEGRFARPRRGACAVSAASALGQDVHDADGRDPGALSQAGGFPGIARHARSRRQIPQRLYRNNIFN